MIFTVVLICFCLISGAFLFKNENIPTDDSLIEMGYLLKQTKSQIFLQ